MRGMRAWVVGAFAAGTMLLGACTGLLGDFQSSSSSDGGPTVDGVVQEGSSGESGSSDDAREPGDGGHDATTADDDAAPDHAAPPSGNDAGDAGKEAGPVHGDGTFQPVMDVVLDAGGPAKTGLLATDLSGDGVPDLAACTSSAGSGFSVFLSNKDGTFRQGFTEDDPATSCVGIAAINLAFGAGLTPYLAVLEATGPNSQLAIYESDPGGGNYYLYYPPSSHTPALYALTNVTATSIASDDFDLDGLADIAITAEGSYFQIFRNIGPSGPINSATAATPPFALTTASVNISEGPTDIVFRDLNGDKVPEAIVGTLGVQGYFAIGNPNSVTFFGGLEALRPQWPDPGSPSTIAPRGVTTGDFDGDGAIDIAYADQTTGDVAVFYNGGPPYADAGGYLNFVPPAVTSTEPLPPVGTSPYDIASGDFNGDGKWDLAVSVSGAVTVLLSQGRTWGTQTTYSVGAGDQTSSIVTGDFNDDHKVDIAALYTSKPGIAVFFGN